MKTDCADIFPQSEAPFKELYITGTCGKCEAVQYLTSDIKVGERVYCSTCGDYGIVPEKAQWIGVPL